MATGKRTAPSPARAALEKLEAAQADKIKVAVTDIDGVLRG